MTDSLFLAKLTRSELESFAADMHAKAQQLHTHNRVLSQQATYFRNQATELNQMLQASRREPTKEAPGRTTIHADPTGNLAAGRADKHRKRNDNRKAA